VISSVGRVANMPDESLRFPSDEIRRHAGSVDEIADAVRTARGAVHEITMGTQAYGQLCQFLPAVLSPIFALAIGALHDAEDSLREDAAKLRSTAGEMTATDQSAGRRLRVSGEPLPELPL
jgi:Excreted virulence factor EspC, type VII ESX diderm